MPALHQLDRSMKAMLLSFVVVLNLGMIIGLYYLRTTTHLSPASTIEHYNGSEESGDEMDIPDKYPKPVQEMLVTTHSHILSLSVLFLALGAILWFSGSVRGGVKTFLMVEPIVSVGATFGSLLLIRFVDPVFVWITMVSGILMYASFFLVSAILIYDLAIRKP